MCDITRDLQTPPLSQTATFSQTPPSPWSGKYFMHSRKTFIKHHSVTQRRSRRKLFHACGLLQAIPQSKSFACVGPSDLNCLPQSLHLELLSLSPLQSCLLAVVIRALLT